MDAPPLWMPWRGFEPRRLSALPPQDSVSTSFTTRACGRKIAAGGWVVNSVHSEWTPLNRHAVHLDLRHQVGTMELLVDLNVRDGTTVLAVLHDLGLAAIFFPRLVLIDAGRIVADGTPAEVLTPDRIRHVFGVDPSIVRLPVQATDRRG